MTGYDDVFVSGGTWFGRPLHPSGCAVDVAPRTHPQVLLSFSRPGDAHEHVVSPRSARVVTAGCRAGTIFGYDAGGRGDVVLAPNRLGTAEPWELELEGTFGRLRLVARGPWSTLDWARMRDRLLDARVSRARAAIAAYRDALVA